MDPRHLTAWAYLGAPLACSRGVRGVRGVRVRVCACGARTAQAYYKLALKHHPDKCVHQGKATHEAAASAELFKVAGEAYSVLSDASGRKEYDAKLRLEAAAQQRRSSSGGGYGGYGGRRGGGYAAYESYGGGPFSSYGGGGFSYDPYG